MIDLIQTKMNVINTRTSLLHHLFEEQAELVPNAMAVMAEDGQLSFAELNGRSNQLARLLQQQGVESESIVAVCLDRSVEMVVALLAVLKAGAAYLPIDPNYPVERINFMMADAATAVCLIHSSLSHKLPRLAQNNAIFIDQSDYILSLLSTENLAVTLQPDNLAYIIYTSGSTGTPKGAMITHGGLANYLDWAMQTYPVQAGGAPVHSSIGFDLTVTSLFLPLVAGQPVHLLPEGDAGSLLGRALAETGDFGLVKITPAHLQLLNQIVPADKAGAATQSFVIGGEQLTAEQLAFWRTYAPNMRLFNEYGPTETVVGCCVYEVLSEDGFSGAIPIGQPIANTQLYILDEALQLVPDGEPGELFIGGLGVARGYLNRPSLTAEKFIPDPFSDVPGARLYRTGDLVRKGSDGNYEFLGRIDHQVKVRGYRIELGEIEAVLGQHENVRETAVLVHETSGSKQLIAYLVAEKVPPPAAGELRDFLAERLPEYMIPARFILLDNMPLTINGKIDRRALPQPDNVRPDLERPYLPPRTPTEETLAAIWSRILNIAQVGVADTFFELGGDSIQSIQMLTEAKQAGLHLTLADIYSQQTIANLAALASSIGLNGAGPASPTSLTEPFSLISTTDRAKIPPTAEDAYPLSRLQAWMLYQTELAPDSTVYHNVNSWQVQAAFDGEKLTTTVQLLAQKHPILRTSFDHTSFSQPLQLVWPQVAVPVQLHDLRQLNSVAQEAEIGRWVDQLQNEKFDWTSPPLLRFHFFRRSETTFQFLLNEHHAVLDGWSVSSLATELLQLYGTLLEGGNVDSARAVPFCEYIAAEQESVADAETRAFWQETLAESSNSTVPRWPLAAEKSGLAETAVHEIILPADQVAKLTLVAQQAGVPLKSVLLAAHQKVLGFVCGQEKVLSGLVVNGRTEHNNSEKSLGLFLNTLPFQQALTPGSWLELAQQTFANEAELLTRRRFPLAEIQEMLGGQPLFEVVFNFLHFHVVEALAEDSQISILDKDFFGTIDMALAVDAELDALNGTLSFRLGYSLAEFSPAQIEAMAGYYERTLAAMVAKPDAAHDQFSPLSQVERQQLLVTWNQTESVYPQDQTVVDLFVNQVEKTPQATAVATLQNNHLSYDQLNRRANQLAHTLRGLGVQPNTVVALCLERSPEMIVAMWGSLKAGAAYVPIDPKTPRERVDFILQETEAAVLLTQASIKDRLPAHKQLLRLDSDWPTIAQADEANPQHVATPDDTAYIIYTSGSTGQPKGVLISHRSLLHYVTAGVAHYDFRPNDVALQFASVSFDTAVEEIFPPLLCGAKLLLRNDEMLATTAVFWQICTEHDVTVINLPTAFWHLLANQVANDRYYMPTGLRLIIIGGEKAVPELVQTWREQAPATVRLVNSYGPTESTVVATACDLVGSNAPQWLDRAIIGRPIPNTRIYLLDGQLRPMPIGTWGELHIGGAGLAQGYLKRPALTARHFIPDPFNHEAGARLYKSGDVARYLPDGTIEYGGRLDDQVKIRGFRIELGEIEVALREHPAVQELLLLVREDQPGEKQLVAYLVLDAAQPVSSAELRRYLQPKLPIYMIPAHFILLEAFPLTTNGKIDRRALPQPDGVQGDQERPYTPPRTPSEATLVAIWKQVLNIAQVGIEDSFFELGGDSIRSIQVLAQARQAGINFTLADLFDQQTIANIAALATEQDASAESLQAVPLSKTAPFSLISAADRNKLPPTVEDAYPLSRLQAGMLYHTELAAGTNTGVKSAAWQFSKEGVYRNVNSWHVQARFDDAKLATAVQHLADQHPILRTSFDQTSYSEPLQLVWPQVDVPVQFHDLRQLDAEAQEAEIGRWVEQLIGTDFDWTVAPLLRFHFFQRSETTFQILMNDHHSILDGWSTALLMMAFFDTYRTLLAGSAVEVIETVPFREFVAAEQAAIADPTAQAFWQDALEESNLNKLPRLPLPDTAVSQKAPSLRSSAQGICEIIFPAPHVAQLNQVAQRAGVPLKSVLLAAHLKVLGFICGQEDVMSGLVVNCRPEHSGSEKAIGLFLNTLPFRQKLGAGSWLDLIQQTFATEKGLLNQRRYPMTDILQLVDGKSLFEVVFNFLNFHIYDDLANDDQLAVLDKDFFGYIDLAFAVDVELDDVKGTLSLCLAYDPAKFSAAQVDAWSGYYDRTLKAIAATPNVAHQEFSPLSQAERQQLLVEWNATEKAYPQDDTVVDLFASQVAKTPGKTAVATLPKNLSGKTSNLTYDQLNRRSNQLAHTLRSLGIQPNQVVALCLERSVEMVVAVWGILKSGAAYVPIDPATPQERVDFILQDTKAAVLLTQSSLKDQLPEHRQVLCLDSDWPAIALSDDGNPTTLATPDDTAYIIYTSGSTGLPKGVMISHRSLAHYVTAGTAHYDFQPDDVALQFASISFDTAVEEIFPPLLCGAKLLLRNDDMLATTAVFWEACAAQNITALNLPTAFWHLLCNHLEDDVPLMPAKLRLVIIGGEKAVPELVQSWRKLVPATVRLVNSYGPTESTVVATACDLTGLEAPQWSDKAVIGRPIANTQIYLLNSHNQPVPVGSWGELHIGGVGLAQGYLNRPELTAERFVNLRLDHQSSSVNVAARRYARKLYKSGDEARYLPDGTIEYRGRLDDQVKIRGFRIELGEIEAALRAHPTVQDAIVLAYELSPGQRDLAAYFVSQEPIDSSQLRQYLKDQLPSYMIPAFWAKLDEFPLTTRGKIDRKALPTPDRKSSLMVSDTFVAPQSALESQLARIWQEVLNLPAVSTEADYFELGGHSLQAMRLFALIEKRLGVRRPISLLFQAPTICQLAQAIRQQENTSKWHSLVPIQPQGARTPLFCVHGGAGHVFHYQELARQIGTERPFYGLQPKTDEVTGQSIYSTVEEMATHYIQEIMMVQSEGPYLLSGFCFGGVVAYEMAQQLIQAGNEVGLLAFIDPSTPQNKPKLDRPSLPEPLADRLTRHQKNLTRLGHLARLGYIFRGGMNRLEALWGDYGIDWDKSRAALFQRYLDWSKAVPPRFQDFYFMNLVSTSAVKAYQPERYPGKIILLHSIMDDDEDESMGWTDLPEDGLKLYAIESTHLGILKRPFIDEVATKLQQHLEPFA